MTDLVGQTLGQYTITDQLAKGGMATVFRGRQKSMSRDVAIKILPQALMHDGSFLERFYREVEVIASLQHPHILPVYDFGEYDGVPYIVMALMTGGTLTDVITQGPMSIDDVGLVVRQMADALDYAHAKGIIHRDFKPGNVLLDERGNTYLSDFGLAKITEANSQITGTGMLGTPTYMSPEQAKSAIITPSVDIYALGVTIFQMLTGRVPYEAATPLGVLMAHATEPIPDIQDTRPDVPYAVQNVVAKAMAKSVEERYSTAGSLASAYSSALKSSTGELRGSQIHDALLMTNMLGQVIFVDQSCLKLLKRHHNEARTIIGKSMTQVLGVNAKDADQLIKDVGKTGHVEKRRIEITDAHGEKIAVLCTALATRDDKGGFIGADLTLHPVTDAPIITDFETVEKHLDSQEESYLQTYFVAQMKKVWEMLIQMGGKKLGANLDRIITETAQRNMWQITMQDGQVNVDMRANEADVYQALMAKAVAYAVTIVGKKTIAKGMQSVEDKMDAHVLELVSQLRVVQLFEGLL